MPGAYHPGGTHGFPHKRKRSGPKSKSSPYLGVTQYKRWVVDTGGMLVRSPTDPLASSTYALRLTFTIHAERVVSKPTYGESGAGLQSCVRSGGYTWGVFCQDGKR